MRKIIVAVMSCILLTSSLFALAACSDETRKVNANMTQFYIGNHDGGVGREWLIELAKKFEEEYKEVSFENGKEGVQIWFSHNKEEYKSGNLLATIDGLREDIYFLDGIVYEDFVSQNKLLDISDALTTPNELDNNVTIASKTNSSRLNFYKYSDNKYYAMPFFDQVLGIVYDVDLFESERLYNSGFGPDGKEGTYDDGLPRTYSEFKQLISTMKQKGITPFTWCGADGGYRIDLLTEVWMKYEGHDNFLLNNTFDGEYLFPGDDQPTPISVENGYLLQKQQGKLVALNFAKDILSDEANYSQAAFYNSQMHTDAQEEYLLSVRRPRGTNRIAMIVEGSWWENESKPMFKDMAERYNNATNKYGYGERRFGIIPLPVFEGGSTDDTLYMGKGSSAIVASAKTSHPELCKLFLKYIHTNENLAFFNTITGITRPYDYTMTEEQFNSMTYYGQSLRTLVTSDIKKIYGLTGDNPIRRDSTFFNGWTWNTKINGNPYSDPFLTFRDSENSWITAQTYFDGLSLNYPKDKWDKQMLEWDKKGYINING